MDSEIERPDVFFRVCVASGYQESARAFPSFGASWIMQVLGRAMAWPRVRPNCCISVYITYMRIHLCAGLCPLKGPPGHSWDQFWGYRVAFLGLWAPSAGASS